MADTKRSREKQARNAENRQRERELSEARTRDDEAEPPLECDRRGCTEQATFEVVERYQEDTGHGAVEATAVLCREHTAEESPVNLDGAYEDYRFQVESLSGTTDADGE